MFKFKGQSVKLELPTDADQSVFEEIFKDRDYRPVEEKIQQATAAILDIGGHIGLFSLYAALLNPQVPIFTFEPASENFRLIKQHLKENKIKNVTAKNLAVSDQDGEVQIAISEDSHNHSLFLKGETQAVRSISLSRIFKKFRLDQISLAKIDCEGAEFPIILESADTTLKKVQTFFIEYHQFTPDMQADKLIQRLKSLGYKTQKFPSRYDKRMGMILAER